MRDCYGNRQQAGAALTASVFGFASPTGVLGSAARTMASKFADFLKEHNIDERRLLASSNALERLRPEDRLLREQLKGKKGGVAAASGEEGEKAEPKKPRSGRPVTKRLLSRANAGGPISGPAKTRLVRALNRILEQKKKDPVDVRALF